MVDLIKDKKATTVLDSMVKIIQMIGQILIIIYCDQGSEFKNKLFYDLKMNGFCVQSTIDHRKPVYAERAIRMIRRRLEQYFLMCLNDKLEIAIQRVVHSHNNALSQCNPLIEENLHASPTKVLHNPKLIDDMEKILCACRCNQYSTNIEKKLIQPNPKFKKGNLIRYLMRKCKFSKESSLMGSWSEKICSIHSINKAHPSSPCIHTFCPNWAHTLHQIIYCQSKKTYLRKHLLQTETHLW